MLQRVTDTKKALLNKGLVEFYEQFLSSKLSSEKILIIYFDGVENSEFAAHLPCHH